MTRPASGSDIARVMAACDLDSRRVEDAKTLINGYCAKQTGKPYDGVTGYTNYHDLLANKTWCRRHQHARPLALPHRDRRGGGGQDVYLQNPRQSSRRGAR